MSNTKITIAIVVVLLLAAGAYFAFTRTAAAPAPVETAATTTDSSTAASSTDSASTSVGASSALITYTDAGFSPKDITVKVGDTVRFVNNSSHGMWVASDNHPTHTAYDGTDTHQHCANGVDTGGSFDECKAVDPGTVYSFTFPKAGSFEFHNHVSANHTGTVTVTQ